MLVTRILKLMTAFSGNSLVDVIADDGIFLNQSPHISGRVGGPALEEIKRRQHCPCPNYMHFSLMRETRSWASEFKCVAARQFAARSNKTIPTHGVGVQDCRVVSTSHIGRPDQPQSSCRGVY